MDVGDGVCSCRLFLHVPHRVNDRPLPQKLQSARVGGALVAARFNARVELQDHAEPHLGSRQSAALAEEVYDRLYITGGTGPQDAAG